MITIVIVAGFFLIIMCLAGDIPSKPPKGYCCMSLWRYGTCTCSEREQNIGR